MNYYDDLKVVKFVLSSIFFYLLQLQNSHSSFLFEFHTVLHLSKLEGNRYTHIIASTNLTIKRVCSSVNTYHSGIGSGQADT